MKIDIQKVNPAFQSIMKDPNQTVFLDANFFIPPDRSRYPQVREYPFERFLQNWLIPLWNEFPGLAVHRAVYDELVDEKVRKYAEEQYNASPQRLKIYEDTILNSKEMALLSYYVNKIAVHSKYDPDRDNTKDRGEVRSLAFMAVRNYLFFASDDGLPIRLIKEADKLNTGLENMGIVQMYELIYYLYCSGKYDKKELRILYKYQYYLTANDKKSDPEWSAFIEEMDRIYGKDKR